jgi:tetratricopeptide (TPR) repeat protein
MKPAQRNDPCPCGSGKKFKKCCMTPQIDGLPDAEALKANIGQAFKKMADQKWDEAVDDFKSLVDRVPDRHAVLEAVGACYDGMEDYLGAAEYYEKALAECPESKRFALTYQLAVSRGCGGRVEKAQEAFTRCLELGPDPKISEELKKIVQTLEDMQQGKKSQSFFVVQVQLQRAMTDMDDERFDSALDRLTRIAELEPDNAAIFYNLGVTYTFLNKEDSALANFRKSVELNAGYAQAWYNMGQIHLIKKKDFSGAIQCFQKAIAARPDYIGAHHQRGVAYELLGDPDKALECWNKTLELEPHNAQARQNIQRISDSAASDSAPA